MQRNFFDVFRKGSFLQKMAMPGILLAGVLTFAAAPQMRADDDCERRIARADHKLHEAIEHHGYESRQADHWRHELHEARERCWSNGHRWWDEHEHRWRTDRDWDDHDHQ